jgi:hypothetical protein
MVVSLSHELVLVALSWGLVVVQRAAGFESGPWCSKAVGPVMESPSEVDRDSPLEVRVGGYDAQWGLAFECAPIVMGKGPPSQIASG